MFCFSRNEQTIICVKFCSILDNYLNLILLRMSMIQPKFGLRLSCCLQTFIACPVFIKQEVIPGDNIRSIIAHRSKGYVVKGNRSPITCICLIEPDFAGVNFRIIFYIAAVGDVLPFIIHDREGFIFPNCGSEATGGSSVGIGSWNILCLFYLVCNQLPTIIQAYHKIIRTFCSVQAGIAGQFLVRCRIDNMLWIEADFNFMIHAIIFPLCKCCGQNIVVPDFWYFRGCGEQIFSQVFLLLISANNVFVVRNNSILNSFFNCINDSRSSCNHLGRQRFLSGIVVQVIPDFTGIAILRGNITMENDRFWGGRRIRTADIHQCIIIRSILHHFDQQLVVGGYRAWIIIYPIWIFKYSLQFEIRNRSKDKRTDSICCRAREDVLIDQIVMSVLWNLRTVFFTLNCLLVGFQFHWGTYQHVINSISGLIYSSICFRAGVVSVLSRFTDQHILILVIIIESWNLFVLNLIDRITAAFRKLIDIVILITILFCQSGKHIPVTWIITVECNSFISRFGQVILICLRLRQCIYSFVWGCGDAYLVISYNISIVYYSTSADISSFISILLYS